MSKKLPQIILRYDDQYGHHIIRKDGEYFSIEGYSKKPENYQKAPIYFFPIPREMVEDEFRKQGLELR